MLRREIKAARKNHVPDNLHPARDPVRQAGLHRHRTSRSTTPTGIRRPISPSPARTPTTRCASPTSSSRRSKPTATGTSPGAPSPARSPRPSRRATLWEKIGYAAWACADPGLQYHTTVNDWHTCPASGPIRATNPCSEYMFLDDTACNLASMNLLTFRDAKTPAASTSRATSTRCGCGPSCWKSRC